MSAASTLANYDSNPRFRPDDAIEFGSTPPDWSRNNRFVTRWEGTRYGPPEPDPLLDAWSGWRDDVTISNATLSPDGTLAILDVRARDDERRLGPSDLWFPRLEEGGWSEPEPLAAGVNTPENFENFAVPGPHRGGFRRLGHGPDGCILPIQDLEDRAGRLEGVVPARGDQLPQSLLHALEIPNAVADVDQSARRTPLDVGAFGDLVETQRDQLADVLEREAELLGAADEDESRKIARLVYAIPGAVSPGLGEETDPLVVPDRLRSDSGALGQQVARHEFGRHGRE